MSSSGIDSKRPHNHSICFDRCEYEKKTKTEVVTRLGAILGTFQVPPIITSFHFSELNIQQSTYNMSHFL